MDATTRAAYDAQRNLEGKPFQAACYAPFTSLLLNTLGDAVACCRSQGYVLGNVARESLDQIWSGPRIQAMRKAMLDYRLGPGCEFCEWLIRAGDHGGAIAKHFDWLEVDSTTPEYPSLIEFVLGNECNFACIQCCGYWSSRIRIHREGMPPLPKVYDERFFTDLRRFLPHLKHAKFYGGEPFLTPEIHRVWDMLLEMQLHPTSYILTNGSIWNARVERVLESLKPSLCVSLDAIADRDLLERIRVGARYDVVTGNIQRFREWSRANGRRLSLSFSLMRQNWTELGPMLLYAEENDFDIDIIRVIDPPQFSLFSLPEREMLAIADELDARAPSIRPHLRRLGAKWDEVLRSLRDNATTEQRDDYAHVKEVTAKLHRNTLSRMNDAFHRGDWAKTIEIGATMPKTDKDYLHGVCLLMHAHRRLGDLERADALVQEALTLSKRHSSTYVELAWLRMAQNRFAESVAAGRQVLAVAADDEVGRQHRRYAHHAIVCSLAAQQRADETVDAAEEWWLESQGDDEIKNLCVYFAEQVGRADEVRERLARSATRAVGANE